MRLESLAQIDTGPAQAQSSTDGTGTPQSGSAESPWVRVAGGSQARPGDSGVPIVPSDESERLRQVDGDSSGRQQAVSRIGGTAAARLERQGVTFSADTSKRTQATADDDDGNITVNINPTQATNEVTELEARTSDPKKPVATSQENSQDETSDESPRATRIRATVEGTRLLPQGSGGILQAAVAHIRGEGEAVRAQQEPVPTPVESERQPL